MTGLAVPAASAQEGEWDIAGFVENATYYRDGQDLSKVRNTVPTALRTGVIMLKITPLQLIRAIPSHRISLPQSGTVHRTDDRKRCDAA